MPGVLQRRWRVHNMDRASLLKAVSGLPAEDDDSWTVPEAVLEAVSADAAEARRHVLTFSAWARAAISQLPEVPREEMQATDFSDYYKVVMSRVQFIYGQATHSHEAELRFPACRFQTQLRRRPQFIKDGATCELGVFDGGPNSALVGSFEESKAAFCAALRLVGQRRFEAQSLRAMLECRAPPHARRVESRVLPSATPPISTPPPAASPPLRFPPPPMPFTPCPQRAPVCPPLHPLHPPPPRRRAPPHPPGHSTRPRAHAAYMRLATAHGARPGARATLRVSALWNQQVCPDGGEPAAGE